VDPILSACDFALKAHEGQVRDSGEPYIEHPLQVAAILAGLEMDRATIIAGLLHDVVEDTSASIISISHEFGEEVASLVDGVTKLSNSDFETLVHTDEPEPTGKKRNQETRRRAENLRKIFLAMAKDIRVMVIKLADRLHNMQTLDSVSPERQQRIATETLQIYGPLAHRLGIWQMKWRLEDLCFKYLQPEAFEDIAAKVARTREEREHSIAEVIGLLQARLRDANIDATIQGRPKHLWSIYQKMLKQEIDFTEIYDLTAVRLIVHTVTDCYHALGIVHDLWIPIPGKFADHISHPKPNMYQSLHTKVIGPSGEPLEIQIRTFEMHRTADFGVAAHWRYKEGGGADAFDRKLAWLRQQMFDWHTDARDANEFLRSVTNDLFADQVFVFTPRGEVIDLPAGSTPVDLAYRVHSQVGETCCGARVCGRIVPLSTPLKNGDIVQILTRTGSTPSFDWLTFVKSSHAKNKIRAWFRRLRRAENVEHGKELLVREGTRLGVDTNEVLKDDALEKIAAALNVAGIEDLYAAVGAGTVAAQTVFNKLRESEPHRIELPTSLNPAREGKLNIAPGGVDQVLIRRSRCCQPLPGDEVLGYVSRGRGLVLHRQGCANLMNYQQREPERLVPIDWESGSVERFQTELRIEALDRVGLLNDIGAVFSEAKTNIQQAQIQTNRDKTAIFNLTLEVATVSQLTSIIANIQKLSDVLDVYRVGSTNGKHAA
jgi:GTP pyrophosphokinase